MLPNPDCFKSIALALQRDGYAVVPDFITPLLAAELTRECNVQNLASLLTPAQVGQGSERQHAELIRGDRTRWFDPLAMSVAQTEFWDRMQELRRSLNQSLLLGLDTFETHYALYPPGSRYQRHRDRFRDDDLRVLSMVCYLNEEWLESEGGALRLYLHALQTTAPAAEIFRDIFPHTATLLVFLSAEFEHEVLPATRNRISIAGWFSRRL
jgi:SM-20-related protein